MESLHFFLLELRPETVGVQKRMPEIVLRFPNDLVVWRYFTWLSLALKEVRAWHAVHRSRVIHEPCIPCLWQKTPEDLSLIRLMTAQYRKRVTVRPLDKGDYRG